MLWSMAPKMTKTVFSSRHNGTEHPLFQDVTDQGLRFQVLQKEIALKPRPDSLSVTVCWGDKIGPVAQQL